MGELSQEDRLKYFPIKEGFKPNEQIPAYCCELTKEQYELIKEREMKFYEIDSQRIFECKDGSYVFYVYWR